MYSIVQVNILLWPFRCDNVQFPPRGTSFSHDFPVWYCTSMYGVVQVDVLCFILWIKYFPERYHTSVYCIVQASVLSWVSTTLMSYCIYEHSCQRHCKLTYFSEYVPDFINVHNQDTASSLIALDVNI